MLINLSLTCVCVHVGHELGELVQPDLLAAGLLLEGLEGGADLFGGHSGRLLYRREVLQRFNLKEMSRH